jgi:hypothetical protein
MACARRDWGRCMNRYARAIRCLETGCPLTEVAKCAGLSPAAVDALDTALAWLAQLDVWRPPVAADFALALLEARHTGADAPT